MLATEHSLGAGVAVGNRLWQIVRRSGDDAPVAVLLWAASALHLRDRDVWIGWDGMVRSRRLGLIVNNSRLLILDAQRSPNLASQALGAALRALPGQWAAKHGFAPVLAEAFTDSETHHGTSYKASNWIPLGTSKGFERHRAEFYVPNARPKKLWVYPLCAGGAEAAKSLLCAQALPPEFEKGQIAAVVRCPLLKKQILSLRDVFCELDDPRSMSSRRYRLSTMLTLVCMSLLCGARTLSDIVRSCQLLGQRERATLELRRVKGSDTLRVPCYNAFRERLLKIIRSHWSIENKNHWKRDAQMSEDRPRQKNARTAPGLGILRGALLALIGEPCPKLFARCQRTPSHAHRILVAPLPSK